MKKNLFFGIVLFFPFILFSQTTISGRVLDSSNLPLEGAAVYLNNTSIGTSTNEKGEFELQLKPGSYLLIASYLGYQTAQYSFELESLQTNITFKLEPKTNMLNEVVISNKKKRMSAEDRAYFMRRFKNAFLGKTNLAQECKILNQDILDFDFDLFSKTLEVSASKPLIVEHKGLGYLIYYDLVHFELNPNQVTYLGYTRYENLKGSKRKKRKWASKRKVAYRGSSMHFYRSILKDQLEEEGFKIDHIKRIKNPDRPTDSMIASARKMLRDYYHLPSDRAFSSGNKKMGQQVQIDLKNPENKVLNTQQVKEYDRVRDSLTAIVNASSLPRTVDRVIRTNISSSDFFIQNNDQSFLQFNNHLKIRYMNEPEEDQYRPGPNRLNYQVSIIQLLTSKSEFDSSGTLIHPLDVFVEGYWSYEKIADTLPLDYQPKAP